MFTLSEVEEMLNSIEELELDPDKYYVNRFSSEQGLRVLIGAVLG